MNNHSKPWLHQFRVVPRFVQPLGVATGRVGQCLVFKTDHISGLSGANSSNLSILRGGAFNSAVRMWVLAVSVERYRPKVLPSLLSLSLGSTNDRWALMWTHFWSFSGRRWFSWGPGLLPAAATAAHDLAGGADGAAAICVRRALTCSWSFSFYS